MDDLISLEKPLAKVLLVWPPGTGCLRAVPPLGKLWRESLSPLERSLAGMWHLDEPLLPKSPLTCLFPEPTLGHHPGSIRGLRTQPTVPVSVLSLHPRALSTAWPLCHLQHRSACCLEPPTCSQTQVVPLKGLAGGVCQGTCWHSSCGMRNMGDSCWGYLLCAQCSNRALCMTAFDGQ